MAKAPVVPFSLAVVRMVAVVATTKRAGLLIMVYYLMRRLEQQIINDLKDTRIKRQGLTLSGGDPMHPRNVEALLPFVQRVKKECPDKDIWVWTGYKLDELNDYQRQMLPYIDVLIDGKFIQEQADPSLVWRGSANQVIYRFKV